MAKELKPTLYKKIEACLYILKGYQVVFNTAIQDVPLIKSEEKKGRVFIGSNCIYHDGELRDDIVRVLDNSVNIGG